MAANILLLVLVLLLLLWQHSTSHKLKKLRKETRESADFLNMMIHELRAPLTAVKTSSQLIIDTASMTKEEEGRMLAIIHDSSQNMLEQVSMLLDAAKFEAGQLVFQKVQTDLRNLVEEKLNIFKPAAQTKNVTLRADLNQEVPQVLIDPFRIGQVINNLVSNALKFTPGGGTIAVSVKRKNLRTVEITVSDTGQGIPKDKQKKIFTKYFEVEPGGNHPKGTGLGLYITKAIVEAHGGSISFVSEPGKGTAFTASLPTS